MTATHYKCPNCEERFDERGNLKSHIREAHAKEHVSRPDKINTTHPEQRPMTDVLWERIDALELENNRLREVLQFLKRGSCWCEVGIDNPMMRGLHSNGCERAQAILKQP